MALNLGSENKNTALYCLHGARVMPPSSHRTQDAVAPQRKNSSATHTLMDKYLSQVNGNGTLLYLFASHFALHSAQISHRCLSCANNRIFSVILLFLTAGASAMGGKTSNQHSSHIEKYPTFIRIEMPLFNDSERDYLSSVRVHCITS